MDIPRVTRTALTRYPQTFSVVSRTNLGGHLADSLREKGEVRNVYHVIRAAELATRGRCVDGFVPIHDRLCDEIASTPIAPLLSLGMVAAVLRIRPQRQRSSAFRLPRRYEETPWEDHLRTCAREYADDARALAHFLAGRTPVDVAMVVLLLSSKQRSLLDRYFA